MLLNAREIFLERQARNGDIEASWELIKYYLKTDIVKCAEFATIVADLDPEHCEKKLEEYFGEPIAYEDMLGVIIVGHQQAGDWAIAERWVQKLSDYIDIKYDNVSEEEQECKKSELLQYKWMKENGILDKVENRFMLKWELNKYLKGMFRPDQNDTSISGQGTEKRFSIKNFIGKIKSALAL